MISLDRGLTQRAERYLLARDVSVGYQAQVRQRIAAFCEFVGCDIREDAVTADLVNEWLAGMQAAGQSPHTVDGYRRAILAVINDEDECCGTKLPFLRLRRIKKPRQIIEAYNHREILAIISAAALLIGRLPNGNRRDDFWVGIIESAYSTGLRRGDLLSLSCDSIQPDGTLTRVQNKTGVLTDVVFSREAMVRIGRLDHPGGLAFAWPYHLSYFAPHFEQIKKKADVKRGTFKWLRRSCGSYAERDNPGMGHRALGQTSDKCFKASYEDRTISKPKGVIPPPLSG